MTETDVLNEYSAVAKFIEVWDEFGELPASWKSRHSLCEPHWSTVLIGGSDFVESLNERPQGEVKSTSSGEAAEHEAKQRRLAESLAGQPQDLGEGIGMSSAPTVPVGYQA